MGSTILAKFEGEEDTKDGLGCIGKNPEKWILKPQNSLQKSEKTVRFWSFFERIWVQNRCFSSAV